MSLAVFRRLLKALTRGRWALARNEELRRQFETTDARNALDEQLRTQREQVSEMLAYRAALRLQPQSPPASSRAEFLAQIAALRDAPTEKSNALPRRRVVWPYVAIATVAACVVLGLVLKNTGARMPRTIELGLIAHEPRVRGMFQQLTNTLGPDWRVVEVDTLGELSKWTTETLPDDVRARIWIDEEAELLRGVSRVRSGGVHRVSEPLDPDQPAEVQLRRFAQRIVDDS